MRKVLFIVGGGSRVAYGIGSAWALAQMGHEFDYVIGASMGALAGSFLIEGKIDYALDKIFKALSQSEKPCFALNAYSLIGLLWAKSLSRSDRLRVVATTLRGRPVLLTPERRSYTATMAIPGITVGCPIAIDDCAYVDGSFNPFPVQAIAELTGQAQVFVLPNRPNFDHSQPTKNEIGWAARACLGLPPWLTVRSLAWSSNFKKAVYSASDFGLDVQVLWPGGTRICSFERNPAVLF